MKSNRDVPPKKKATPIVTFAIDVEPICIFDSIIRLSWIIQASTLDITRRESKSAIVQKSNKHCKARHCKSIAIEWQGQRGVILICPLALFRGVQFGRNAKFLLTLTNNKWPLGIDPGDHQFVALKVSINNTPFFVSEVVIFERKISVNHQLLD